MPPRSSSRLSSIARTSDFPYCAVTPPSITISLPVMKEDSSEARKRTP